MEEIEPGLGMAAMEEAVSRGEAQMTVAGVEWKQFKAVYEARAARRLLDGVESREGEPRKGKAGEGEWKERLKAKPAGERRGELRRWVGQKASETLGYGEGRDSMRNRDSSRWDGLAAGRGAEERAGTGTGVTLAPTVAFDHPKSKA